MTDNVRIFVMDNNGNIYHICKYRKDEWDKWKHLEDDGMLDYSDIPKGSVRVDFLDCIQRGNFEFIVV